MTADIYTAIAVELAKVGGIDTVGVVSSEGQTAILYAGTKTMTKYIRGPKKQALLFQISGMDVNDRQQELIRHVTDIVNRLECSRIDVQGISGAKVTVNNMPIPTMHNEKHWIYSANIQIEFYLKG